MGISKRQKIIAAILMAIPGAYYLGLFFFSIVVISSEASDEALTMSSILFLIFAVLAILSIIGLFKEKKGFLISGIAVSVIGLADSISGVFNKFVIGDSVDNFLELVILGLCFIYPLIVMSKMTKSLKAQQMRLGSV